MGRRLLAFGLSVAIQAAALSAPLIHAHLDDHDDDHHGAGRIHAHLDGHRPHDHDDADAPALQGEESPERVVGVPLFVAAQPETPIEPALAPAPFELPSVATSLMRRRPGEVRSHGPPAPSSLAARAPPAFSVLI